MAVTFIKLRNHFKLMYPVWSMWQTFRLNSENKDSMESFISELTSRKVNKFNQLRTDMSRNQSQNEITSAEQEDAIAEVHNCLDTNDDDKLEIEIDKWLGSHAKNALPRSVICEVLEHSSATGNCVVFEKLNSHIKASQRQFYDYNIIYFESLSLELEWKSGRSIDQVLEQLEHLYTKSLLQEPKLRHAEKLFTKILQDAVENRGESAVIKLKGIIERICKETKDHKLLFNLWRSLFESFWYSDQQIASELLLQHVQLRRTLSKQLSILCFVYLRNNNTELVNRLIQIFLQFNMTKQVEASVRILFEFECWRKNLDAVLQIVQLCLKLDIHLSEKENKKFLNLLLKRPSGDERRPDRKIPIHKYQFKF